MEDVRVGTLTFYIGTPKFVPALSAAERNEVAESLSVELLAKLNEAAHPLRCKLRLLSADPGCIKGKYIFLLVAASAFDYASKYKDFRESIPLLFDDGKTIILECLIRGNKVKCPVWLQGSDTAATLHVVQPGDTLSAIVKQWNMKPYTDRQVMAATLLQNPQAFVNGDINRLKAGAMLTSPTRESLKRIRA